MLIDKSRETKEKPVMIRKMRHTLWLFCLILVACAPQRPLTPAKARPVTLSYPYLTPQEAAIPGFRALAERVVDSYVVVTITRPDHYGTGSGPMDVTRASGIVVDARGYVITAAHIAKSPKFDASVTDRGGHTHRARIVAIDPTQELALLKLAPKNGLRPVRLAASKLLKKGDIALAIGSPGQRSGVVTLGRVRYPDIGERLDYGAYGFDNAIELSMEVESGHSGGPVFNQRGELIGIVAGYELGDTSKTPYVSPRITYVVPSDTIAKFLARTIGRK